MTEPLTWSISASGQPVLLTLTDGQRSIVRRSERRGSGAAEELATLCEEFGVTAREIRRVRVDTGPGSFTGLRVAIVTARTIAEFAGASIESFTSFEMLSVAALRAGVANAGDTIQFAFDARRDHVHEGLVRFDPEGRAALVRPPKAIATNEFRVEDDALVVLDDSLKEPLATQLDGARIVSRPVPDPEVLLDPRLRSTERASADVSPLYLMGTYADG